MTKLLLFPVLLIPISANSEMPAQITNAFTGAGRLAQFYRFNLRARFYSVLNYVIATSALRQVGQYVFNAK